MTTPNLALQEVPSGSLQPSVPVNDSLQVLDALVQLAVQDKDLTAPPATTAADVGKCWIVAASATGAWAGKDAAIALCTGVDAWRFLAPREGWTAAVLDEVGNPSYGFDGAAWVRVAGGGEVADNSITYAKLQDISATQRVIGRNAAGAGDPEEVSASQLLDWLSTAHGAVLFRASTGWVALAPGTSGHYLQTKGADADPVWAEVASGGGSLTGFTSSLNTAAPNATVPVAALVATDAATNVDAAVVPKGSGALLASIPDSAATGGNKRGQRAVDLQQIRATNTQVASGNESVVAGGRSNTASAQYAVVVGGLNNTASAQYAVAGGFSSTASGNYACALGQGAVASANDAVALGGGTANAEGAHAHGRGANTNSVVGAFSEGYTSAPPRSRYTLHGSTTDATEKALTTNAGAAAATNQVYFGNLNNRSGIYRGLVVARQTGNGGAKKSWEFVAHLDRDSGALALVAPVSPTVIADSGVPWTLNVTADDSLKTLKVAVVGEAAKTIRWSCFVEGQEVAGT
jgi:hypothetical protein